MQRFLLPRSRLSPTSRTGLPSCGTRDGDSESASIMYDTAALAYPTRPDALASPAI